MAIWAGHSVLQGLVPLSTANFSKFQNYVHSDNAYDYSELVNEALTKLMELDGLLVEIVGNWIWISGETKANKDALKNLGCFYASKNKCGTTAQKNTNAPEAAKRQSKRLEKNLGLQAQ